MLVNPLFSQEFLPSGFVPAAFYNPQVFEEYVKPKLVKKIENEELIQFNIFKADGDFSNFEFKLIKLNEYQGLLEVFSLYDNFKVSIKLNLTKVDIHNINFEVDDYNRAILNLNIPKHVEVYNPNEYVNRYLNCFVRPDYECETRKQQEELVRREQERQEKERKEQEKQERLRRIKKEQERQERIRKEQERQERIRKEQERARKEQERQLRIQREKEARLRKVKEEKARKEQEEQQRQAQEFFNRMFSGFLGPNLRAQKQPEPEPAAQFPFNSSSEIPLPFAFPFGHYASQRDEPSYKKAKPQPKRADPVPDPEISAPAAEVIEKTPTPQPVVESPPSSPAVMTHDLDETASINSDISVETPDTSSSLHKHPSIEEVEDEEFVMLRKKFGQ